MRNGRKQIVEFRPYVDGEVLDGVSISAEDKKAGSPKIGDMIARNPKNHDDQWLVSCGSDDMEELRKFAVFLDLISAGSSQSEALAKVYGEVVYAAQDEKSEVER